MSDCKCRLCNEHRKVKSIIKSRNVDRLIKLVCKLEDENLHLGSELEHCDVILNGTWPSSVRILTQALKQAKKYAATKLKTK